MFTIQEERLTDCMTEYIDYPQSPENSDAAAEDDNDTIVNVSAYLAIPQELSHLSGETLSGYHTTIGRFHVPDDTRLIANIQPPDALSPVTDDQLKGFHLAVQTLDVKPITSPAMCMEEFQDRLGWLSACEDGGPNWNPRTFLSGAGPELPHSNGREPDPWSQQADAESDDGLVTQNKRLESIYIIRHEGSKMEDWPELMPIDCSRPIKARYHGQSSFRDSSRYRL